MQEPAQWHTLTYEQAATTLETSPESGLTQAVANERYARFGPNELREKPRPSPVMLFLRQFNDFTVWVLLAAAVISELVLHELVESLTIVAILILNAILGFIQEYRAERALAALKEMAAPHSTVIRDSIEQKVFATALVPGDIVLLEAGDIVPADGRLAFVASLLVDESTLTGESVPAIKTSDPLPEQELEVADRTNMVYAGTTVFSGRGKVVVVNTGSHTEVGEIARLVQSEEPLTPLQIELERVGRSIAYIVIAIAAIVFGVGLLRGLDIGFMLLAAVSLAVAAIPEGLPAIVTVTLALGVQSMAAQSAIVRRLHAVETLGSTTVICTDKTGTLTLNKMTAEQIYLNERIAGVRDLVSRPADTDVDPHDLKQLITIAVLCNDAHRLPDGTLAGDPTETALITLAESLSTDDNKSADAKPYDQHAAAHLPRVAEIPFDSRRKRMTTVHSRDGSFLVAVKGAPEVVVPRCAYEYREAGSVELNQARRDQLLEVNARLAAEGYRSLAFAFKDIAILPEQLVDESPIEAELVFTGFVFLVDPPRPEVEKAIKTAFDAHTDVIMITGDHELTATAIADRIGLLRGRRALTGSELDRLSDEQLAGIIPEIGVFSRVDPLDKVKIVSALKLRGQIIAMTGDGVNDAPAIKQADIGIAMGDVGTEVAKEASDMVLADDNFATIVKAIRQGRQIFDNLKKFILFLLSCNISEVLTIFIALIIGMPVPLLPTQILWTNLITDGMPALALGVEPPEQDLMQRAPRNVGDSILERGRLIRVAWQGFVLTLSVLAAFAGALLIRGESLFAMPDINGADIAAARTVAFAALVVAQLLHSLNYRTVSGSVLSRETLKNRWLLRAIAASIVLQLMVIYVPFLQGFFSTQPLSAGDWLLIAACILPALALIDITKVRNSIGRF